MKKVMILPFFKSSEEIEHIGEHNSFLILLLTPIVYIQFFITIYLGNNKSSPEKL